MSGAAAIIKENKPLDSNNTTLGKSYEAPAAYPILLAPEQCIAISDTLEDYDNNPIYEESF